LNQVLFEFFEISCTVSPARTWSSGWPSTGAWRTLPPLDTRAVSAPSGRLVGALAVAVAASAAAIVAVAFCLTCAVAARMAASVGAYAVAVA